jgi:hypothetical protein
VQQPGGGTELGGPAVREPVVVEDDVPVVERVGGPSPWLRPPVVYASMPTRSSRLKRYR